MTSQEDMLLAEMAIEKYAEAKGLDVNEVKKKWLPILQAEKEKDPFTESLINACSVLGQIKEVGKGLDPATQEMLSKLSSLAIQHALNPQQQPPDEDEKLVKIIRRLKILDHAFTDEDKLTEEIAEKVSQEVAQPLAQALSGLNETLEKIAEKTEESPEDYAGNTELAELSQAVEKINERLDMLSEKLEKGPITTSEAETDVEAMIQQIRDATEKSKAFLEKQGFKISVSDAPATLEEAKKLVEEHGYRVLDSRISREEAERMAKEAEEKAKREIDEQLQLKLEEKKIEAAKEVTATAIDRIMQPLQYFLEKYLSTAIGEIPKPETPAPNPARQPAKPQPKPVVEKPKPKLKVKPRSARKH